MRGGIRGRADPRASHAAGSGDAGAREPDAAAPARRADPGFSARAGHYLSWLKLLSGLALVPALGLHDGLGQHRLPGQSPAVRPLESDRLRHVHRFLLPDVAVAVVLARFSAAAGGVHRAAGDLHRLPQPAGVGREEGVHEGPSALLVRHAAEQDGNEGRGGEEGGVGEGSADPLRRGGRGERSRRSRAPARRRGRPKGSTARGSSWPRR